MRIRFMTMCVLTLFAFSSTRAETSSSFPERPYLELLLVSGNFDKLESIADGIREAAEPETGGGAQLASFYEALGGVPEKIHSCGRDNTKIPFEAKHDALAKWIQAKPNSITAPTAMSELWFSYANDARGCGYANTVKPEEWNLYGKRLGEASAYIQAIDTKKDPYTYIQYTSIAIATGSEARRVIDAIYADAIRNFPRYYALYSQHASLLQERWFGAPGDRANYIRSLLKSPGGEDGLIAYATVASSIAACGCEGRDVYKNTGLLWPVVQKAFAAVEKRYGVKPARLNTLLFYAWAANDKETAAAIIERQDFDLFAGHIWSGVQQFAEVQSWSGAHAVSMNTKMTTLDNWIEPAKLDSLLQNPVLNLDITKFDPSRLPVHIKAGLYSEQGEFDAPQLETAGNISLPHVTYFKAPKLQTAHDITLPETVAFDAPVLKTVGKINARVANTFYAPQLETAEDLNPEAAIELNLPSLRKVYGHIVTHARRLELPLLEAVTELFLPDVEYLHLPALKNVLGHIIVMKATDIDLPSLQYALDYIHAGEASKFNVPELRLVNEIQLGPVPTLNFPQLQYAGNISGGLNLSNINLPELRRIDFVFACDAKTLEVPKLETVDYILTPLLAAFDAPRLRDVSGFIYVAKASSFKAPELETVAQHVFFTRTSNNFEVPKLQDAENRVLAPGDSNLQTLELSHRGLCINMLPQP